MKNNLQTLKYMHLEIYRQAHNNAIELFKESKILFEKQCYPRAYFLAFTALEEIAKSQHAADVFTGFSQEEEFNKSFKNHMNKIGRVAWAREDASSYPHNLVIWLGPGMDDIEKITPNEPSWEKRQDSLYVGIGKTGVDMPKDKITKRDAKGIVHIVDTALKQIWEMTEYWGHNIGTKGFMK